MPEEFPINGIEVAVARAGSQQALAAALNCTQQAVSKWVARGFAPTGGIAPIDRAKQISGLYDIPYKDLIDPSIASNI